MRGQTGGEGDVPPEVGQYGTPPRPRPSNPSSDDAELKGGSFLSEAFLH